MKLHLHGPLVHMLISMIQGNSAYQAPLQGEFRPLTELRSFYVGDARYLGMPLSPMPKVKFPHDEIFPVTVLEVPNGTDFNGSWAQSVVTSWLSTDDVFRSEFLRNVILVISNNLTTDQNIVTGALPPSWGTGRSTSISSQDAGPSISSGPFVMWKGELCRAFRLYDDVQQAFVVATEPHIQPGPYKNLRLSGDFYSSLSVAVPSRIGFDDIKDGPLAGARFAVKDIFAIEGLRQTAGCRAWFDLSEPSLVTAPALQKLVDRGAQLTGTLKLGSLITREEPTESTDYHAPFNPRGDGYQSAWSSSGGSGAAVAAYDWLDFTLAQDTTGSSRRPALANGCFQIRVSQAALPPDHIVPSWRLFDAPAMYARDIKKLEKWVGAWISAESEPFDKLPVSIIYPKDFLPVSNTEQMNLIDGFVKDLEKTLGVKKTELSLRDLWKEKRPSNASSDIDVQLQNIGVDSFCYGVYKELEPFRDAYYEKYKKAPYVNPVMRWRWNEVKNETKELYDDAMKHLRVYKDWVLTEVLQVGKRNTVIVLPITTQAVDYRDVPPDPPSAPKAFDGIWLAPTLGAPEVSIPIGEIQYHSRVSERNEYLPIVVSLLGAPGSDMALLDVARRTLEQAGRSTSVATGSRLNVSEKYVRNVG